jgi:hypothetical protein
MENTIRYPSSTSKINQIIYCQFIEKIKIKLKILFSILFYNNNILTTVVNFNNNVKRKQ